MPHACFRHGIGLVLDKHGQGSEMDGNEILRNTICLSQPARQSSYACERLPLGTRYRFFHRKLYKSAVFFDEAVKS